MVTYMISKHRQTKEAYLPTRLPVQLTNQSILYYNNLMNTKIFAGIASALAVIPSMGFAAKKKAPKDNRPNILFILADDMGRECLGSYGSTYSTPNLDAFAQQGVLFNECSAQPLSTPSRVEALTGKYNHKNYSKFAFLNQDQKTFANLAKDAGYKTCVSGKWQLGQNSKLPAHFGFDNYSLYHLTFKGNKYCKPEFEEDGVVHKEATEDQYGPDYFSDYLLRWIESNKERPWLAYYSMTLVHDPFNATPDSEDWDVDPKKRYVEDNKYFPEMVTYCDKIFGKIMKKLNDLKLADNTIVIFVGDNGTARYITTPMKDGSFVRGGKGMPIETGTGVPLIASWGKYNSKLQSHSVNDLVDFTDFMPTFAEAMNIQVPTEWDIDGRSFLPVLKGEKNPNEREWVFVHYQPNHVPQANLERYSCRFFKDHTYKYYSNGAFYNYRKDPDELRSIPAKEQTPAEKTLRMKYKKMMSELPAWKMGDNPVKPVMLPGLEVKEKNNEGE